MTTLRFSPAGHILAPEGVRFHRTDTVPFMRWGNGSGPVYEVWRDEVLLGYAERRGNVPVFDGANRSNRSGFHRETQWVAFLPGGRVTDEAHETRAEVAYELIKRAATHVHDWRYSRSLGGWFCFDHVEPVPQP